MRPVNKGESPYITIGDYCEALPYLEDRIGLYCSFCGFPIPHVPEVEHVTAKAEGGDLTAWGNLLLGCKYCNTRKGKKVTPENVEDYLWPDRYNTALAYTYDHGVPAVNASILMTVDPEGSALAKARHLFDLVQLDHIPTAREKDRRFRTRNKAFEVACDSFADYQEGKKNDPNSIELLRRIIVRTAIQSGFFSVWMTVFKEEPEVLRALIAAFPGTEKECFDDNGMPKLILVKEKVLCTV